MAMLDPVERTSRGSATCAEVTGATLAEPQTLYEESWRDFIYAEIWTRPGLHRRARYLISIAGASAAGGCSDALENYVRGSLTSGELTLAELREAALHIAVYGGWQRGGELDAAATKAAEALGIDAVRLDPICAVPWDPVDRVERGIAEFHKVMTFPGPPPISPYFEAGIDNFVFAEMWNRRGLDETSRRWITLVGVCDSGAETPIKSHIHAAMASGNCTPEELHEFVLQYGVHAGWPRASLVQGIVFAMAKNVAAGLPYTS